MEQKTKLHAEDGRQDLLITREFDLPVELLFKAYTDSELFEEWMGTRVIIFDIRQHGAYRFESADPSGKIVFKAHGTIHECTSNSRIIRTFEMEDTPFPTQIEYLDFESLSADTSKLSMHIVYKSEEFRNRMLQMPFAFGLNMAHNRLEETLIRFK